MRDYHDPRSRIRNEPGRRPSPPPRQWGANHDDNKVVHRHEIGADMGNVYILEDDDPRDVSQAPPRDQDLRKRDQTTSELNSGNRSSNRVPLQDYADINTSNVRRSSFDSSNQPDNHNDAIKEHSVPQTEVDSDNEYDAPQFEEPEDYIIANIPPGAEAYHEHSMKLKRGNNVSASMIASRKLSDAGKEQEMDNEKIGPVESRDAVSMSPESLRDKPEDIEDLTKSPSLPLKKRKYVVSPGRVDDTDMASEQEAETFVKAKDSSDASQKRLSGVEQHSTILENKTETEDKADDAFPMESGKHDVDEMDKQTDHKSDTGQKENEIANKVPIIKVEDNQDEPMDDDAGTAKCVKSDKVAQISETKKAENKERLRPLLSASNTEPINKKKRKRDNKSKER